MAHALVVHCKRAKFDVYIGRGRGSKWGNPYKLTDYKFANPDGSPAPFDEVTAREMCLRDFEHALHVGMLDFSVEDVRRELRGKVLACWCAPKSCHGDVLARIANPAGESDQGG
jgi:hypothetical protein